MLQTVVLYQSQVGTPLHIVIMTPSLVFTGKLKPVGRVKIKELGKLDGPVVVFSPQAGDTLIVGQTVVVNAMLLLPQFNFEVDTIQVRLWRIATKEEYILRLDQAPKATDIKVFHLNYTLTIPATIPPGDDYRLSISGRSADKTVGLGFTIPVKVIEEP